MEKAWPWTDNPNPRLTLTRTLKLFAMHFVTAPLGLGLVWVGSTYLIYHMISE